MYINHFYKYLIIFILFSIIIMSCSVTEENPEDTQVLPPENLKVKRCIRPPDNIQVTRDKYDYLISWDPVRYAREYKVYRRYGTNGIFMYLATTENTHYWDREEEYDTTKQMQYQIISVGRSDSSGPARSSFVSHYVQNIVTGIFESRTGITVSWDIHPEDPDFYRVYRYAALDEGETPVMINEGVLNYFIDEYADETGLPASYTPYFYRVTWVKDGDELGMENAPYAFGIYSSQLDTNETGEDKDEAKIMTKGVNPLDAFIYSFGDGNGGVVADVDWYRYIKETDAAETVNFIVHLPKDGSLDGYVKINLYDGDTKINEDPIALSYVNGGQECFLNLSDTSGSGYFEIFTTFDSGTSILEEYSVKLE